MNRSKTLLTALAATLTLSVATNASAALLITEVDAAGSGATYGADWFELSNTGASSINLTGWKMDDSSGTAGSASAAVALRGVTSIAAGQSVIFLEGNLTGTTDSTIQTNFISAWFGGSAPVGLTLGFYGGGGVGLSTTAGDAVNLFNAAGVQQASVTFGVTPTGATLDNTAGLSGAISTASVAGINGAFLAPNGETGSPGSVSPVPVPAAAWLLTSGLGALGAFRRRRKAA